MPELTYGRLRPARALLLDGAGLAGVTRDGSRVTIGATTPVAELVGLPAPLGPCAANVADVEIRAQATVGGNLCAGQGRDAPRGDLQGALLALGATVRSAGAGGEPTRAAGGLPAAARRAARARRLLRRARRRRASPRLDRPHTHDYTALAVSAARAADGTVRLAVTGVAGARRAAPVCRGEGGRSRRRRPGRARTTSTFADDALASAWYRERTLPVLVRRVLTAARGGRMNLTVNGIEHEIESAPLTPLLRRAPRGARDHEPEGRLPAGRLRRVHRARRRRAAPLLPAAGGRARRRRGHDRRGPRHAGGALAAAAGLPPPLRGAVRLLHLGDAARRARATSSAAAATSARRSRRRSPGTSAAAPAT